VPGELLFHQPPGHVALLHSDAPGSRGINFIFLKSLISKAFMQDSILARDTVALRNVYSNNNFNMYGTALNGGCENKKPDLFPKPGFSKLHQPIPA
jgi:hypothetical protein